MTSTNNVGTMKLASEYKKNENRNYYEEIKTSNWGIFSNLSVVFCQLSRKCTLRSGAELNNICLLNYNHYLLNLLQYIKIWADHHVHRKQHTGGTEHDCI